MKDSKYDPEDIDTKYLVPNEDLIKLKNISPEYRQVLTDTYKLLTMVLNRPDLYENAVEYVEALEYTLQILWGFPPDNRRHTYWMRLKGCLCPYHDNMELIGTGERIVNGDCPFHANREANRNE